VFDSLNIFSAQGSSVDRRPPPRTTRAKLFSSVTDSTLPVPAEPGVTVFSGRSRLLSGRWRQYFFLPGWPTWRHIPEDWHHNIRLSNSMAQCPSREADSSATSQIPLYRITSSPHLFLSWARLIQFTPSYPLLEDPILYPSIWAWVFQVVPFLQVSTPIPCMYFSSPPYVPHAQPITYSVIWSSE